MGVTDAGLAKLAASNQFRDLDLSGTGITNAGLAVLSGQAKLRTLALARTKFDDAGAAALATIPALEVLILSEDSITDRRPGEPPAGPPGSSTSTSEARRSPPGAWRPLKTAKPGLTVETSPWTKLQETLGRFSPFAPRK